MATLALVSSCLARLTPFPASQDLQGGLSVHSPVPLTPVEVFKAGCTTLSGSTGIARGGSALSQRNKACVGAQGTMTGEWQRHVGRRGLPKFTWPCTGDPSPLPSCLCGQTPALCEDPRCPPGRLQQVGWGCSKPPSLGQAPGRCAEEGLDARGPQARAAADANLTSSSFSHALLWDCGSWAPIQLL